MKQHQIKGYYNVYSEQELIDDLKRVAKLTGSDTVKRNDYIKHGAHIRCTVMKRFGSWNAALTAAGLKLNVPKKPGKTALLLNLEKMWIKLGRKPRLCDMDSKHSVCRSEYYTLYFGSFKNALSEYIKHLNKHRKNKISSPLKQGHSRGSKKSKAKRKRRTYRTVNHRLRYEILMRDGCACVLCGRSPANERGVKLTVDHIKPWSKGGETIPENLRILCRECNMGKGDRD